MTISYQKFLEDVGCRWAARGFWPTFFAEEEPRRSTIYWDKTRIVPRLEEEVAAAVDLWYGAAAARRRVSMTISEHFHARKGLKNSLI